MSLSTLYHLRSRDPKKFAQKVFFPKSNVCFALEKNVVNRSSNRWAKRLKFERAVASAGEMSFLGDLLVNESGFDSFFVESQALA